jgi:putative glutamine amidotransferase
MARPLVGITCRHEELDLKRTYHNIHPYDYQFVPFAERVARAGGIPVLLPNIPGLLEPGLWLEKIDILVLSGGEDVHPKHYKEKIRADNLNLRRERDAFELPLVQAFWEEQRPIFAICRGIQVLNVALGGTLYQDLSLFPNATDHTREGHEYERKHTVRIIPDARLAQICGCDEFSVNTSHHQVIKDVAPGLRAVAWSAPDGIIEAVEASDGRPTLGVQWHPEMMSDDTSERLFRQLVKL